MSSPTQRTLAECDRLGWIAQVVERWNPWARRRVDLFGCIDIVACAGSQLVGIQACSGGDHAKRSEKARKEPRLGAWLAAGCAFEVWSWSKKGKRGKRKVWTLRREPLTLGFGPSISVGDASIRWQRIA